MPKDPSQSIILSDSQLHALLNDTVFVGNDRDLQKLRIKNGEFNYFKVDQLKAIIKYIRSECNRYDLSLSGKKADLVERLKLVINRSSSSGTSSSNGSASNSTGSSSGPTPPPRQTAKRPSFTSLPSQLKLQPVNDEEQRLLKVFSEDKTLKGRIDPHQQVERIVYVKVFHNSLATFSFDFDLSEEEYKKLASQNYQIHIHYFTHDMVPRNWNAEYLVFMNSMRLETPTLNRKIAKNIKKEVLIVSTPFVIKGLISKQVGNRIDIKASPYSTLDGRLVVNFVKIVKSDELVQSIISKSTRTHNLDIESEINKDNKIKYVPVTSTNESIITFDETSSKMTMSPVTDNEKQAFGNLLKLVELETPINKSDDMVEELEGCDEIVPLKDPLSLCRIEIPTKGKFCVHKSCFDLSGYLEFGQSSKTYNCPRCDKPVPFNQLIIDPLMQKVLSTVGQDVEKVLVRHDGTFTVCDDAPKKRVSTTPAKPTMVVADIIDDDDDEEQPLHCSSPPFKHHSNPSTPLPSMIPPSSSMAMSSTPTNTAPTNLMYPFMDFFSSPSSTPPTTNNNSFIHPNPTTPQNKNVNNTPNSNNGRNVISASANNNSYGLSVDDAIEIDD